MSLNQKSKPDIKKKRSSKSKGNQKKRDIPVSIKGFDRIRQNLKHAKAHKHIRKGIKIIRQKLFL
jgi:hypothetical protein